MKLAAISFETVLSSYLTIIVNFFQKKSNMKCPNYVYWTYATTHIVQNVVTQAIFTNINFHMGHGKIYFEVH